MEEILPEKDILEKATKIEVDEGNLVLKLVVKSKIDLKNDFASPNEVKEMLQIFGGIKEDFPINIRVDNKAQKIEFKFDSKDNMNRIHSILSSLWDRVENLLKQVIAGDLSSVQEIPDIDG
jgi:hypothetical protein